MKNGLGMDWRHRPAPHGLHLGRGKLGEGSQTTRAGKEVSLTQGNTSKGDSMPNLDFHFDRDAKRG